MKNKKVLIISYSFPPSQMPESLMAYNNSKYLNSFGWDATVVCARNPSNFLNDEVALLNDILKDDLRIKSITTNKNKIFDILYQIKIIPDNNMGWIPSAIKASKDIIKREQIDIIVSRSMPISSHLVAYVLKILYKLPWIACFSDPWTQNPYITYPIKKLKKLDEFYERQILSNADRIIVTSDYAKNLLSQRTIGAEKTFHVIPNSCDMYNIPLQDPEKNKNKLVISHIGNLYGIRSPEPFLRAFQQMQSECKLKHNIEVRFIGNVDAYKDKIASYKLGNSILLIDTVPWKEIPNYISESNLLLLIDAPCNGPNVFLPSKLIEYIFAGKPILAITSEGASSEVIRETRTGFVADPKDVLEIKNVLMDIYNKHQNSNLVIYPNKSNIEKYRAKNCSKLLAEIMDELAYSDQSHNRR